MLKSLLLSSILLVSTNVFAEKIPSAVTQDATLYVDGKTCSLSTGRAEVQGPCQVFQEGGLILTTKQKHGQTLNMYVFSDQAKSYGENIDTIFADVLKAAYKKSYSSSYNEIPATESALEQVERLKVQEDLM